MPITVSMSPETSVQFYSAEYAALAILSCGPNVSALDLITDGPRVSWWGDTPTEDHEVTMLMCQAWGVPCRTVAEMEIESYGGTPDRPTHYLGSAVYPPADYLD